MLYKDEAIVLRTMRLGEADRIVTFVGRGQGKIRAVAKGVRKTKSRFGGRLEPFTQVSLVMWRGRSDLDIVTQADAVESNRSVREDLDRFALGQVMLEAVDRVVQEKEASPRVFNLLVEGLKGLGASGSPLVLAWFLLLLNDLLVEGAWMRTDPEIVTAAAKLARSYAEYHLERRLKAATAGEALAAKR
jgi:DNA repair protein RecO (recombination protein O)